MISSDDILSECSLRKVRDLTRIDVGNGEMLKSFIDNIIYPHPNCSTLLTNFSDLHVLCVHSEYWKDLMKDERYIERTTDETLINYNNLMLQKTHTKFILGYMLIKREGNTDYIEYFDTTFRGFNLGRYMLEKYDELIKYEWDKIVCLPREIIPSSVMYWANQLDFLDLEDNERICKSKVDNYLRVNNINIRKLSWQYLFVKMEDNL